MYCHLEGDEVLGEAPLGPAQGLRRRHQALHLLDQLLDVVARPLQLLLVAVQAVPGIWRLRYRGSERNTKTF